MHIDELLRASTELGASDLHITVGRPPMIRLNGRMQQLIGSSADGIIFDTERVSVLVNQLMHEKQQQKYEQIGEVDFSYSIAGLSRFRVNVFKQRGTPAMVARVIPTKVPNVDELGLPEVVKNLARRPNGLILVTGPTGSGKSTTLAAMIDQINHEFEGHIITLEDPIEFLHRHNKCIVNQREIGADSESFASGLRAALRQDPDIILVGEMRDLETISTAITAAETGHLVLATLHTSSAVQTIDRIIDVFPPHQQNQVKIQLSLILQGIIAQTLIPRADGLGRVIAVETLVANTAARNLIREGKTPQLQSVIQSSSRLGMQTMDSSLRDLYSRGIISYEEAVKRAADPDSFSRPVRGF